MRLIPIVCDGDWLSLWFVAVDGDDVSEDHVLLAEAQKMFEQSRGDQDEDDTEEPIWRIDPAGVQGHFTPNLSIELQVLNDGKWCTDCTLTIPMYDPPEEEITKRT